MTRGFVAVVAAVAVACVACPAVARAQDAAAAAARVPAPGEGYLGLVVDQRNNQRVVSSIDPAGPAASTGLRVGDLIDTAIAPPPNFWSSDILQYGQSLDDWSRRHKPGTVISLIYLRSGWLMARTAKITLADGGSAAPTAAVGQPAAAPVSAVETAHTAYLNMCGKGSATLSAATCAIMKRDLDQQAQAQAAAAREAEVMGVYRKLCGSGTSTLSAATCASMLAEAKLQLAAPAAPAPTVVAETVAPAPAAPREQTARGASELGSAYDELCKPGAEQVSAATCASLKADAGRAGTSR